MKNAGEQLLGEYAAVYLPLLDELAVHLSQHTWEYEFLRDDLFRDLLEKDMQAGSQMYWLEILYRAHMAASTSLLRSHHWLKGAIHGIESDNLLTFAACWRGFMEAASDTYDGLGNTAETLANYYKEVSEAVIGQARSFGICKEIENRLIHFLVARKVAPNEDASNSHRAKQTRQYFEALKTLKEPVLDFYREICELTHPSMASVNVYLTTLPDGRMKLQTSKGGQVIRDLIQKHRKAIPSVVLCGINTPLITLKLLNRFPVERLSTPYLDRLRFDQIPVGKRIGQKLGKPF